jgi:hypothetical protein
MALRAGAANALRYWEPRRVVYNVVLVIVMIGLVIARGRGSHVTMTWDRLPRFLYLALLMNICYFAAYIVDLLVCFSKHQSALPVWRWLAFVVGTILAAFITTLLSIAIIEEPIY